jgi:hypothetical protein
MVEERTWLEILGFICEAVLWILDAFCVGADVFSWFKGKPNRIVRKQAKRAGGEPPPRDRWHGRVVVFTIAVGLISILLFTLRSATR